MSITAGTRLGHYEIRSTLGAGGQGQVYKAVDTTLDRPVVIKVLFSDNLVKPSAIARFEREAKLASSLDHPNICTIHGLHEVDGVRFIAMQYIEGQTVRELVAGKPQELNIALSVAIQVADALAAAHSRGIIHRDIKPGNVMVTDSGMVKVLDFGLAKLLEQGNDDSNDEHLTQLGLTERPRPPHRSRRPVSLQTTARIFSQQVCCFMSCWPVRGPSKARAWSRSVMPSSTKRRNRWPKRERSNQP